MMNDDDDGLNDFYFIVVVVSSYFCNISLEKSHFYSLIFIDFCLPHTRLGFTLTNRRTIKREENQRHTDGRMDVYSHTLWKRLFNWLKHETVILVWLLIQYTSFCQSCCRYRFSGLLNFFYKIQTNFERSLNMFSAVLSQQNSQSNLQTFIFAASFF